MSLVNAGHFLSWSPCVIESQCWVLAADQDQVVGRVQTGWGFVVGHDWLLYQKCFLQVDQLDCVVIASCHQSITVEPSDHISCINLYVLCWLKTRYFSLLPLIWALNTKIVQRFFINFPQLDRCKLAIIWSLKLAWAWCKDILSEWILG